jgi:hypothetical protein
MNASSEFLPADELAKFIVLDVVRPQIEAFRDRGIPVEAQTVFVAHNQRKNGPKLGAVRRAIPVQVEIRCQPLYSQVTQVICHSRLIQSPPPSGETLEWDLTAKVRRDEKGLYVQGLLVSSHIPPEAELGAAGQPLGLSTLPP